MADNGTEDGTNIHNVGALCQTQGKKFIPASFYQVNVIILTTEKSREGNLITKDGNSRNNVRQQSGSRRYLHT